MNKQTDKETKKYSYLFYLNLSVIFQKGGDNIEITHKTFYFKIISVQIIR